MPSAFSLPQNDIDQVFRLGGSDDASRMRVAAQFTMGKSTEEIAAFLQQEYRGGMGLNTGSGKMSAWFDERGAWLARGDHARDAAPGMFIPWMDVADRIGELMDAGQFATNVELTETQNHYRSALAQSIWYLRHDFSEMTEGVPLLSSLDEYRGGGFPEETARLAKALSGPQTLASVTKDMEFFAQVYARQRGVLRFHYHDVPMLVEGLHNLETPWREYSTDMFAVPKTEQFITEDEVDEALTHGSSVSGGKGRIYRYFSDEHSNKERADFLREEYGIGGHSGALSNKAHSFEDHDGKGIRLSKADCAEVTLSWNTVARRIDTLVKTGRYLTEKEMAQLEQANSEPVQTAPAEPEPAVQEAVSPVKEAASPTVGDLYAHYLPIVRDAVLADTAYQNACRNSDRENAMTEGNAAINRAVISLYDTQLYGLFYDNTAFHNRLTQEVLEETYDQLSPHEEERTEPEQEDDDFADIDPEWVRARLAEHGIVNGEVVDPEKLAQSPFIQMVEVDVARIAAEEDAAEAAHEPAGAEEPTAEAGSDALAPEDRFHVVAVDWYPGRPAYSIWDDQTGDYYVDRDGVTIDFVSRWDAEEYRDDLIDTLRQEEKPVPEPSLAEQAEQFDADQQAYREQVLSGLTPDQQRIVTAMETAGFPFRPTETNLIYFGDLDDYPITFDSWEAAYDFINSAELKDFPGLREQVQAVLHPEPAFPYHAGDTVYLEDGKPFVIESIGTFDVQLRDPALRYPVFRAESRENFLRLMERYPQHQQEEPSPDQPTVTDAPTMTEETVGFYPGEQNGLPFDVEIRTLHFDEPEREASTPEVSAVTPETPESAVFEDVYGTEPGQMPGDVMATDGQTDNLPPTPESAPESVTEQSIPVANFRITDDHLGEGGPKQKYAYNVAAIRTLQTLEAEGRNATPEEQQILSRYVGWGSLADAFDGQKDSWANEYRELKGLLTEEEYAAARASTLNAHYTSPAVIRAIYEAIGRMGFSTGNILEPSMGVGNFFGLLPDSMAGSRLYGVELDSITGRIAQKLYPNADIKVAGFESTDRRDFYDLAVGNVPFGDYRVNDKPYNKLGFSIHNYFFAKALDQVRPGGVVAFVTSRYTMDAKSPEVRKYLAQRAELLGAIRLPNNAFRANAGTDVVSDIIFLQKREHPIDIEPEWVHLGQTPDGLTLNSYFIDHPEMVLGELTTESTQYGREECTVIPIPGADLSEQLHEAVTHIQGSYQAIELEAEEVDVADGPQPIPADPNVKNFSYTIVDGDVYFRENSVMKPVELNDTAKGRVKGLVELRQIVNDLIAYQLEDYPEADIAAKQQELNTAYDSFTERYGLINSRGNSLAFSEDSSYYLLCSLENIDEDGQLIGKADMFTKRTIRPERKVTSVDTPSEALAISIGEKGAVDLPFMAELLGTPGEYDAIISSLHGVIFKDPMGPDAPDEGWQTADEYLSGNVRDKLRIASMAADCDPTFAVNVEALTKAQPKDLDASEIDVRLGATWIDPKYFQQFMHETFQTPFYMRRTIEVKYSTHTAEWRITGKTQPRYDDVAANMTFGTSRANAYRILEDILNLKDVRIYDTVEDADGKQKRVLNKKETTLAQQKQQAIKDAFQDWVWKDPKRREALCQKYNELFNSTRPREFDGSHIHFVGMNPEIMLREHQRNAIAHVLYGGNTLLAHEVGAGKTFEMAAAAMESKRLGLCQKSMFVVPNHLTLQWANEFLRLYPSAKLLVTTKKDFETSRRKKFCARIATGDYDAVIIGHSQFEKIPISEERQERQLREQIEDIEDAIAELKYSRGENFTIKQMEKTRKSLQARLNKLTSTERKDDVITFEQLGVDRLFVDESQAYKNLFLYTKMRNVAGLSTSEAQRSSDMFMKCRYMDEITGGRGVVFASGTPVSNSMTELYTVMRYLQYSTLQQKGLTHFDSWASTFGETTLE